MVDKRSMALIRDPDAELVERVKALEVLLTDDASIAPFLIEQLETELDRNDTRFVIYLLGAIGQAYDRQFVSPLVTLLGQSEVESTFRMQCLQVLQEFYQESLVGLELISEAVEEKRLDDPAVLRFLAAPERASQFFSFKGDPLNDQDREEIEKAFQALAGDEEKAEPLNEEARAALEIIAELKNPSKELLTSLLGIPTE